MAMNCAEFLRLMDTDAPVNTGEASAHVESCASCREAYARWQSIRSELKSMKEEPAPPFLHSRVMIHVRTAAPERAARWGFFTWSRVPWAGPLLAAALLILIGGYGLLIILEPAKQSKEQREAQRAKEIQTLKKDLPPMAGASKTTVEKQYDDILSRADADKKAQAEKSKHALTKEEAPLHYSGLKKEAEEATKAEENAPIEEEFKTRGLPPPPAPAFAPEPAAPAAAAPKPSPPAASPSPRQSASTPAVAGHLGAAARPSEENQAQAENVPASRDQRLRREADKGVETARAAAVACVLEPAGGGSRAYLTLPSSAAPAEGSPWILVVRSDGTVAKADRGAIPSSVSETIAALHLAPGRYFLKRTQ
jgi:hypothetical protein